MIELNTDLLWHVFIFSAVIMFTGWLFQLKTKNAGIVDILWSGLLSLANMYVAIQGSGDGLLRVIFGIIGGVWFARLAYFLFNRVMNESEDGRYLAIRNFFDGSGNGNDNANNANKFLFVFFQMQAGLILMCALPIWLISHYTNISIVQIGIACLIIIIAFIGEHTADQQLHEWRTNPDNKGKTCCSGLWKYSRHPNYFFEWCHWLAYPILATGSPYGAWLWLAPLVMFCFLYWGTGIPYTEKQALKTRGEDYKQYQQKTSVFFPLPPKQ